MDALGLVHTLTFDAFGTILDLGGSHAPRLGEFLKSKGSEMTAGELWARWRSRQRIEQYQDNQFSAGHYGYLDSSRRALIYILRSSKLPFGDGDISRIMDGWQELMPFPDAVPGLQRLRSKFKLVVLSNGEKEFLAHVVKHRIQVYRYAARMLKAEPCELLMVSSNSFDVVGARASGYRGGYVNRYDLPYDETPYRFDIEARDFLDMAGKLGCQ